MANPDFSDARAKLARANDHIANVNSLIVGFLSTDFYRLHFETDKETGRTKVVFDSLHQPDSQFNLVLGDAISNLRSTLDYIAVALLHPVTGTWEGTFPFADSQGDFEARIKKGNLSGCAVRVVDELIKVQAYPGGSGDSLWRLNKLRNIDKHRLLIATAEIAGFIVSFRDNNGNVWIGGGMGVSAGQSGIFIDAEPGIKIDFTDQPKPTFEILIDEPSEGIRVEVRSFLDAANKDINRLLDALDVALTSP